MRSEDTPTLVAVRAGVFAAAAVALGFGLATKPASAPFAVGGPLFAAGIFLHLTSRRLEGRPLAVASFLGLLAAAAGALLLATQDALVTSVGLVVVAVAGILRVPGLLGPRAPKVLAWIPGREAPLLVLGATVAAWQAGRARAGGDVVLVDWMAGTAAALALAVLFVPRPRLEWAASPGRRHQQRVKLRPDPRAVAWRDRSAAFVERGADADAYFTEWRRVLVRSGLDEAAADRAVAEARAASDRRTLLRSRDRERRSRAHAALVQRLTRKIDSPEGA